MLAAAGRHTAAERAIKAILKQHVDKQQRIAYLAVEELLREKEAEASMKGEGKKKKKGVGQGSALPEQHSGKEAG